MKGKQGVITFTIIEKYGRIMLLKSGIQKI